MRKYQSVVLYVLVCVLLFAFLRVFSEYHFYTIEQNQLFQASRFFVVEKLGTIGGVSALISGWLVQFFILPGVGAVIVSVLLTGIGGVSIALFRRMDPGSLTFLWAWLPALCLLFVQWDFNYQFQGTIAFGLMLITLYLVLGIRDDRVRLGIGLVATLLLFWMAGAVALLFSLFVVGYECLRRTPRWYFFLLLPMLMGGVGWLCVWLGIVGEYRFAFLPDAYYCSRLRPDKVIYFSWIAIYMGMILTFWGRKCKTPIGWRRWGLSILQVLIIAFVFFKGVDLYGEKKSYRLKKMDYFARTEQWDQILSLCKSRQTNLLYICYQNLALARKGVLAEEAFHYSQLGPNGLILGWNKSTIVSALLSEIYLSLGLVSATQDMAFESYLSASSGGNPRMLQRLVQTNLVYGAYPVAEKYISILEHTFYYKEWAKDQRRFLYDDAAVERDPFLGDLRKDLSTESSHLVMVDGLVSDLLCLIERNPSNKTAFQFLGVAFLLEKNMTNFKKFLETYYGTEWMPVLPLSFQEAIMVLSENDPEYRQRFVVSEAVEKRFAEYKRQILSNRRNAIDLSGLLYRSYGDTYWYYYMFVG